MLLTIQNKKLVKIHPVSTIYPQGGPVDMYNIGGVHYVIASDYAKLTVLTPAVLQKLGIRKPQTVVGRMTKKKTHGSSEK